MKKYKSIVLILIVFVLLTFCGCLYKSGAFINLKTNYSDNSLSASYTSLNGTIYQKISFNKDDKVYFSFNFTKENDNKLWFEVVDKDNEIIITKEEIFEGTIIIPENGKYKIKVLGEKAMGDFTLLWEVLE